MLTPNSLRRTDVIYCLRDAVVNHYPNTKYQTDIEKITMIAPLRKYLVDNIKGIFSSIAGANRAFRSRLRDKLNGIGEIYRLNRNEAGHPDEVEQDWDRVEVETYLIGFRRYIPTVYEAIDLLT